jgi:hypothetical protein
MSTTENIPFDIRLERAHKDLYSCNTELITAAAKTFAEGLKSSDAGIRMQTSSVVLEKFLRPVSLEKDILIAANILIRTVSDGNKTGMGEVGNIIKSAKSGLSERLGLVETLEIMLDILRTTADKPTFPTS